ncbi:MAG: hypothetical protein AAF551_09580 [Bacteroidota bacterium]
MKWKIVIKILYLIVLLVIAAIGWKDEPRLIDSDPSSDHGIYQASLAD